MNENGRIGCLLKKMEGKKILEAFLETQKGTFKVETTSDMEKFHVIDTDWIQTDDLQYIRQVEEYVYELAEARYIGPADKDSYLIVSGRI